VYVCVKEKAIAKGKKERKKPNTQRECVYVVSSLLII